LFYFINVETVFYKMEILINKLSNVLKHVELFPFVYINDSGSGNLIKLKCYASQLCVGSRCGT